ncbi:MAG: recombinase family protein [Clostridia bacterium]|nr:recombinase family protein [Clostridia bacterium]
MRCVGYMRETSWKQNIPLYTIEEQKAKIRTFAEASDWELVGYYSDKGSSDDNFKKMMQRGLEGCFDCVAFQSIYFAANEFPSVTQRLEDTLYPAGIHFCSVAENFTTLDKTSHEVHAYFEEKRRERHYDITKAWKASKGKGFLLTNSIPFGYIRRLGEDQVIKDEEVRPVVEAIFQKVLAGESLNEIVEWLNAEQVPTPGELKRIRRGENRLQGGWKREKLKMLITNPVYTGAKVNGKHQILDTGCYEAYISVDDFQRISPKKYVRAKEKAEQKTTATQRVRKKRDVPPQVYCECGLEIRNRSIGKPCNCGCGRTHLPLEQIEQEAQRALEQERKQAADYEEKVRAGIYEAKRIAQKEKGMRQARTSLAEIELEQQQRLPLYQDYQAGKITESEYRIRLEAMQESFRSLDEQLKRALEQQNEIDRAYSLKNPWLLQYTSPVSRTVREDIRKNTDRITLAGQQVKITFGNSNWKKLLTEDTEG